MVQPLLDFCLEKPEGVISIEVSDSQAKEGVIKVFIIKIVVLLSSSTPMSANP